MYIHISIETEREREREIPLTLYGSRPLPLAGLPSDPLIIIIISSSSSCSISTIVSPSEGLTQAES